MSRRSTTEEYLAHVVRTYDIERPEEYRALFRAQGGRCYICRDAQGANRRLAVDHDHLTNETRSLLCSGSLNANTCNRLIGRYNRAQLLRAAAVLSDPPPARAVLSVMRSGEEDPLIPSLVGGKPFYLHEVLR